MKLLWKFAVCENQGKKEGASLCAAALNSPYSHNIGYMFLFLYHYTY